MNQSTDARKASGPLSQRTGMFVLLAIALGFLPLIYWHVLGVLSKPHYQFLLLSPLGFWLLYSAGVRDSETVEKHARVYPKVGFGIAFVGWLLCLTASVLWSPWMAMAALLLAVFGLLVRTTIDRRIWGPMWLFAVLWLPLPFGIDEDLIVGLRSTTTELTSGVLDQIGVLHQCYANVIEVPGKPLFIADACSGIHSLYVLLAVAFFMCLFLRRTVLHSVLLLGSTFLLVLIENVVRIVIVAVALRYSRDLSEGPKHELLGFVLFAISAGLILSIDQLLSFSLPAEPMRPLLRLLGSRRDVGTSNADPGNDSILPSSKPWWFLAAAFIPLALVQVGTRPVAGLPQISSLLQSELEVPELGEEALPVEIGGLRRVGYELVQRVPGDPFGKSSQRWLYENGPIKASISLDYPYSGVKDMCLCYLNTGWEITNRDVIQSDEDADIGRALVSRELFGNGIVLFSSFDLEGETRALVKSLSEAAAKKESRSLSGILKGRRDDRSDSDSNPPYIQVQLFVKTHDQFDEQAITDMESTYREMRHRLRDLALQAIAR